MMYHCKNHGVTLDIREDATGRTVRHFRQRGGYNRPKCLLYAIKEPKAIEPGERYQNALTGRDAYSMCLIEEE